jgi:hypothetical protein
MRHVALEGRCFVLSACQYLTRADCPKDYDAIQGNDPTTVLMRGGSCIIGPLGQVLAGPHFDSPCILTADLDLDEIPKSKYDFDVVDIRDPISSVSMSIPSPCHRSLLRRGFADPFKKAWKCEKADGARYIRANAQRRWRGIYDPIPPRGIRDMIHPFWNQITNAQSAFT